MTLKAEENLERILRHKKLSHTYMFESDTIETLRRVSIDFAVKILGRDDRTKALIDEGNHPDFYYLATEENSIKKEDTQDLMYRMNQKPIESAYKVYVIENFEKLTIQAENSILKFLEEPPKNTISILLTTDKSSILPTIHSRSQHIFIPGKISDRLEQLDELSASLKNIVSLLAIDTEHVETLEDNFSKIVSETKRVADDWLKEDPRALIRLKDLLTLCNEKRDYHLIITLFDGYMRQAMYQVLEIEGFHLFDIDTSMNQVNVIRLTNNLMEIEKANQMLSFNVNPMLVFESMIISSKG